MSDTYPAGASPDGSTPQANAPAGVKRQAETARQKLGEAGQALKSEAQSFAQDARQRASQRADQASTRVGSTIHTFADAIRKAGDDLGEHDQTFASRIVREAADGLESFSRALAEKRPEEMLDQVRDFGRRNPAAFIAGSVLAGLALGRFARASARREEDYDVADYDPYLESGAGGGGLYGAEPDLPPEGLQADLADDYEPLPANVSIDTDDRPAAAGQGTEQEASPAALAEGGELGVGRGGTDVERELGQGRGRGRGPDGGI